MVYLGGIEAGLVQMLNDPGKICFHVIIVPLIAYSLFGKIKVHSLFIKKFRTLGRVFKVLLSLLIVVIVAVIVRQTNVDLHRGFCERLPNPQDISEDVTRAHLHEVWIKNHQDALSFLKKHKNDSIVKIRLTQLKAGYAEAVGVSLRRQEKASTDLPFYQCSYFLANASGIVYIDYFLSVSTVLLSCLLLVIIILCVFEYFKNNTHTEVTDFVNLFETLSLLPIWIVFRFYSEYYNHFFIVDNDNYGALYNVLIYLVLTNILLFILYYVQYRSFTRLVEEGVLYPVLVNTVTILSAFNILDLLSVKGLVITLLEFGFLNWFLFYTLVTIIFILLIKPNTKPAPNQRTDARP